MDYNNPLNKGIADIKKVSLSDSEKDAMLSHLHAYADAHPVPVSSSWFNRFHFKEHRFVYATVFAVFTIMISGGVVAIAAENSLPGDSLYPFKIYVNEPIQGSFKPAPEWEEKKMVKRLDEVQALVERGDFDNAKRTQVEKEVEKSAKTISKKRSPSKDFEDKVDSRLEKINKTSDIKYIEKSVEKEEVRQLVEKVKERVHTKDRDRDQDQDESKRKGDKMKLQNNWVI